jgi:DNA sulfur modification protein DndB
MARKVRRRGKETPANQPAVSDAVTALLQTKGALTAEYRKRNSSHAFLTIHPADEAQHVAQGWEVHRRGKKRLRMRRLKDHDRSLEDRAWCLFYRMGYPEIGGTRFAIRFRRADGSFGEKRVDLFAKDDETVIVGECKSRESRGRRSLQKDLHETESLQAPIASAIRSYYGQSFKPKIIWIYFTQNIIWSEPDLERAGSINVRVVTENEFAYFEAFIRYMGPAGRFQFLAEFLQGQAIPGLSNVRVPATRGKLGKHTFYSFVTTPETLLKISYINHLALNHPDGRPAYQRMINPGRIRTIGEFIKHGGYFPTNLLVNFTEGCRFDQISNKENSDQNIKFGWLYLPNKYKSAWVIDGQHRLYGFSHLDRDAQRRSSIFVIAFEKMDTTTEADLFITINHKQKSVPKSVLIALQSDLKWGSADAKERVVALSSALVKSLNSDPTSPFFQRFAVQGVAPKDNQNLTIPEAVNGLVRSNVLGRVGKVYSSGYFCAATDEQTLDRARKVLNGYFGALREASPPRWEGGKLFHVAVNPGVRAHLLLIGEIIRYLAARDSTFDVLTASETQILEKLITMAAPVFSFFGNAVETTLYEKFSRKFGEGGVREYFFNMCEIVRAKYPDFGSTEFIAHLSRKADQRILEANQGIIDLEKSVRDYVTYTLKKVYGTKEMKSGEKAYWELGIESAKAKEDAYKAQQAAPVEKRLPKEAYLHLLDLMKIVRQKENWPHFETVFSLPMPGEKGKTYYLDWMERLNELRRIPAHASSLRTYDEDDYAFLNWLKPEFYGRLERTDFRDAA